MSRENFGEQNLLSTIDYKNKKRQQNEQLALFNDPSREVLYKKALEQVSGPELDEFIQEGVSDENMYSEASIKHDEQLLDSFTKNKRGNFVELQNREILRQKETVFKAMLSQLIIREKILGELVSVGIPSRYDAETTGIPLVIHIGKTSKPHDPSEPHQPEPQIALGIIPTFSDENDKELSGSARIEKLLLRVEQNNLARMKYYEDPTTGEKRPLMQLPAVMISRKTEKLLPLIDAWNKKVTPDPKVLQAFKQDIFEQILTQLSYFPEYAKFYDQPEIMRQYTKIREALDPIIKGDADLREALTRKSVIKTPIELKQSILYRS